MARTVRDARLGKAAERERLAARHAPYWRLIEEGAHLGYRKGERGGKWLARWREPGADGGYCQTGLGEADDVSDADGVRILNFAQAQAKARDWFRGQSTPGTAHNGPYTIGDALDDYMAGFEGKSKAATLNRVEAIIRPALGHIDTARLTAEQLNRWLRERARSPARLRTGRFATSPNLRPADDPDAQRRRKATVNRDLTVLKAALNAAFRAGRIASDTPWRRVTGFRNADAPRLRYLSDGEALRLVNACAPAFRPMAQAALLTGARYGELRKARVADFDEAAGTLAIPDPKSGKSRHAFIPADGTPLFAHAALGRDARAALFTHPSGRAWKPAEQTRYLAAASQAAGLEPVTFHDLRRTYGARLARQGVPMAVIAEALGHADERMTRRHYAHLAPSYVSDTIRRHAGGLGIVEADAGNGGSADAMARRTSTARP